ncbi:MAG: hypothetical protein KKB20_29420 [Proteobacteria bacterium]|nr:hypothetical protein [Pseudomonadota bacterium]
MSSVVSGITAPAAVLPSGVARIYTESDFTSAARASLKSAGSRPGQTWSRTSQENARDLLLGELRTRTTRLSEAIRLYEIPDRSTLTTFRVASSSSPDRFMASAESGTTTGLHPFQVNYLARSQTNSSIRLNGAEAADLDSVTYSYDSDLQGEVGEFGFDLTVGDETHSVSVRAVRSGIRAETNRDLLEKIGRQIEAADDRLATSIQTHEIADENGNPVEWVSLKLGTRTGYEDLGFSLADTIGDMVASLGLDRTGSPPSPAAGRFDGESWSSWTNDVALDQGRISVSLLDATGSGEHIEVREGFQALLDQTKDLLDEYNGYIEFLNDHRQEIKRTIFYDLMTEMDHRSRDIENLGLSARGDGRFDLTDRFTQTLAAEPDRVGEELTGDAGLFTSIKAVLDEVLSRDMNMYDRQIKTVPRVYRGSGRLLQGFRTGLRLSVLT